MKTKQFWTTWSLVSLCIVALLGFTLRSKILFPLPFINFDHFVNAHSHFAFSGWVTLSFFNLYIHSLIPAPYRERRWYQVMLYGVGLCSVGMLFSFAISGYSILSIILSTLFIFFTYGYCACLLKDVLRVKPLPPATIMAAGAMVSLLISSAGPFTLAYLKASGATDAILYKDAIYFYLHFQYNGFFTLSVFSLYFYAAGQKYQTVSGRSFAYLLCVSTIPSFFLSLLWHSNSVVIQLLAAAGAVLIICSLIAFFKLRRSPVYRSSPAQTLWILAVISFFIKSVLQTGTLIPALGNAVFGLRPIIIGFLHLVFLGLTTFAILAQYIEDGIFDIRIRFVRGAIWLFAAAVIIQETVLLIQGIGLLTGNAFPVYHQVLWYISMLLVIGALWLLLAQWRTGRMVNGL